MKFWSLFQGDAEATGLAICGSERVAELSATGATAQADSAKMANNDVAAIRSFMISILVVVLLSPPTCSAVRRKQENGKPPDLLQKQRFEELLYAPNNTCAALYFFYLPRRSCFRQKERVCAAGYFVAIGPAGDDQLAGVTSATRCL